MFTREQILSILRTKNDKVIENALVTNNFPSEIVDDSQNKSPDTIVDLSETFSLKINDNKINFYTSNNCIVSYTNSNPEVKYLLNIRCVNYYIKPDGRFIIYPDDDSLNRKLISINKYFLLNKDFEVIEDHLFDPPRIVNEFNGLEDLRIFPFQNKLIYSAVTLHRNNKIGIVMGDYNLTSPRLSYEELSQDFSDSVTEKNWIFFERNDQLKIIYKFYPLTICSIIKNENQESKLKVDEIKHNLPEWFSYLRGSSNGVRNGDEIWFVAHTSCKSIPRQYYNIFLIFDLQMNLLRYSPLFKLEASGIEFCMSLIIEKEEDKDEKEDKEEDNKDKGRIILSCSHWDRTTKIMTWKLNTINNFINIPNENINRKSNHVIVSSFLLNINSNPGNIPYLKYGRELLQVDCNKIIYLDEKVYPLMKKFENEKTKLIPVKRDIINLYKYLDQIKQFRPITDNPGKDTIDYMFLMCAKTQFMQMAINSKLFDSDNYIWIDFGIYRFFLKDNLKFISKLMYIPSYDKIRIGNIWDLDADYKVDIYKKISWYFAGGVFGGNKKAMLKFSKLMDEKCKQIIKQKSSIMWEVNVWYLVYLENKELFAPYNTDHNQTLVLDY